MDATAAAQRLSHAFHSVFLAFQRRGSGRHRELTFEALGVLEHLAEAGPLTVGEAARHFARSQSATSEIVNRLERRGLLRRFRDQRDRRRHLVWLTEDGLAAWREARTVLDEPRLGRALATMSARRRRELVLALEGVAAAARPGR